MTTTFLNSTFKTGQYKRKLPVFRNRPSSSNPNQYIADPGSPATAVSLTDVQAQVLGAGSGYTDSVTPGTYISNNATSGITFLVFNRVTNIRGVTLNVGPNNGSTSTRDFGDSIYIETGDHSTNSRTTPLNFINSNIVTGTASSPINDNDLVVFGSDQSKDGQTYTFAVGAATPATPTTPAQPAPTVTINGLLAPGSTQSPMNLQGSSVTTGNGNDTLIFANTVASSQIGGTAPGQGNTFTLGAQNDLVYFASPSQIRAQNVIDLGTGDDTLVFNRTATSGSQLLSGLTGTGSSVLNVRGFNEANDRIFFNGVAYNPTQKATITSVSGNKIIFS
jgi:hypothetical protein